MEWQPIETAPTDGTFLLLYEGATTKCMWRGQFMDDQWIMGATSDDRTMFVCIRIKPTHWMPLPPPPKG